MMIPTAVAISVGGLVFMLGALTFRIARRSVLPVNDGGPPAPVLIGSYAFIIAGGIVLLLWGIPE